MSYELRKGTLIDENTIRLELPLTPSRNQVDRWTYTRSLREIQAHKASQFVAVKATLYQALGKFERWADHVVFAAIRCSNSRRRVDVSNIIGGLKQSEDCVVRCRLILDDDPGHVTWGPCEDRAGGPSRWGTLPGPCTHLLIVRTRTHYAQIMPVADAINRILQWMADTAPPAPPPVYADLA